MCYGHFCQIILTKLLFGKSIALVVYRCHLGTGVHCHSRHHLLLLLLISVWVLLQLSPLWYTGAVTAADDRCIKPGNVCSHSTDRPETVLKRNFQLTLDAGLGVEALGRILEGTSVNVDG